jgi:chemotaxis protein MotB
MSGTPIIIIKKKGAHGGSHGAAWKVAYADFVTAMMALFIVLWLLAQTDQNIKKELSEYFRSGVFSGAPSLLEGGSGLLDKGFIDRTTPSVAEPVMDGNADMLRSGLNKMMEDEQGLSNIKDSIRITATPEGVLIEFIDNNQDLLFDLSSSALKPPLERVLARLGPILAKAAFRIRIQGHTDARPFPAASGRSNWLLSFERADRARRILETNGFPSEQIVGVFAFGSSAPLEPNEPGAAHNRRLSLLAIPPELDGDRAGARRGPAAPRDPEVAPSDALEP